MSSVPHPHVAVLSLQVSAPDRLVHHPVHDHLVVGSVHHLPEAHLSNDLPRAHHLSVNVFLVHLPLVQPGGRHPVLGHVHLRLLEDDPDRLLSLHVIDEAVTELAGVPHLAGGDSRPLRGLHLLTEEVDMVGDAARVEAGVHLHHREDGDEARVGVEVGLRLGDVVIATGTD